MLAWLGSSRQPGRRAAGLALWRQEEPQRRGDEMSLHPEPAALRGTCPWVRVGDVARPRWCRAPRRALPGGWRGAPTPERCWAGAGLAAGSLEGSGGRRRRPAGSFPGGLWGRSGPSRRCPALLPGKRTKKGMATAKQRLGKILKIHRNGKLLL